LREGRDYTIRYNKNILPGRYEAFLAEYIEILKNRFPNSNFKLLGAAFEGNALLKAECAYKGGGKVIGEGSVAIEVEDGNIADYYLRVSEFVNIALASASIESALDPQFEILRNYIAGRYKAITGKDLAVPQDPVEAVSYLRALVMLLPKAKPISAEEQDARNRAMLELLHNA